MVRRDGHLERAWLTVDGTVNDSPHQTHGGCPMSGHQLDHHEADTMVHRLCLVGLVIVDESKVC